MSIRGGLSSRSLTLFAILGCALVLAALPAAGQEASIDWVVGPDRADLGAQAQLEVSDGYVFAGPEDTRTILSSMGNPPTGQELGMIVPKSEDQNWFLVFEHAAVGYVRDDEKDEIDADALFKTISEATEAANDYRREHGFGGLHLVDWAERPHYEEATHNLVWALAAKDDDGGETVNYNIRLLGREGYTSVTLVTDLRSFALDKPQVDKVLTGFTYQQGKRYADFRAGDKIAKYGLTALVAGGAGAAAVKLGLFAKLGKLLVKGWKLLLVGFAAIGTWLKRLFGGGRKEEEGLEPPAQP